jgi:hypothetical protein
MISCCFGSVGRAALTVGRSLPIYPDKQAFSGYDGMSQRYHKRKSSTAWVMFR